MKRIFFFLFILGLTIPAFSQQLREFNSDTSIFVSQFEDFMSDLNEGQELEFRSFINRWISDSIDYDTKLEFISSANHLLRRRGRPVPHFISYIEILNHSYSPQNQDLKIQNWLTAYSNMLATSTVNFNEIQRAQSIVLQIIQDSILYDLAGTKWDFNAEEYYFDFNEDKPIVKFSNTDLNCMSDKDTMKIFGTNGIYDPIKLNWKGSGGKVTWEKAGLDPDMVFAILNNYKLLLNRPYFDADSVKFYYKKYFDYPLEGKLQERASQISSPERAMFPKFFSYQSEYSIPQLFPSIEYSGGLSMQGSKLVGTGTGDKLASINIYTGDTVRMAVESKNIVIRENTITSLSASVKIFLETDSIFHPELQFVYLEDGDEIRLTKGATYTSGVPYIDSYHKVNMNFEEMLWKRGSGKISLKPSTGRALGQATFESNNFFNYNYYADMQGRDYSHPLVGLWRFSNQLNGWREFPVSAYAGNIGKQEYQVRHQMMKLSRQGFLYFDEETGMIKLTDKLFYFLEASVGRTDYDVIFFLSEVNAPMDNGTLDLETFDLKVNGVQNIFLSDSQNVVLVPDKNQIIIKRNRNFQFGGSIRAGLLTMYGSNFFFDYERFSINLQDIDSLRISVQDNNKITGERRSFDIDNLVQDLTGEILIDNPENKSGLKDFPDFPIFRSKENSYVYFDDPAIQGGVYNRNEVFFEIYPFELDSLDNFSRSGMNLSGKFESQGMIPALEQTLILQADNSLGFEYSTPDEGIPVYNGKGTFYNDIVMSSNGLHGAGQLDYITSSTFSDDLTFHPDSLMTNSREFMMRKQTSGTQYPKVNSTNNKIVWFTKKDEFYADMNDIPFTMFQDTIRLKGDLKLTPSELSGNGNFDMVTSSIQSDYFKYRADQILADTSSFRLKSVSSSKFAITTDNVRSNIDLASKTGQFFANDDFTLVDFPEIVYESRLDFFKWDMMDESVEMGLNKEILEEGFSEFDDGLTGPRYISKMPSQDSLSFVAPQAIYDYRKATLEAKEVPFILVADSRIYPNEGNVSVGRNAVMRQLTDAGIVTDTNTEFYQFFNSMVSVNGRYDYTASADYNYVDISGEPQVIHFTKIQVDTSIQSIGFANISKTDSFQLSPYFKFLGQVRMNARKPFLVFDGGAKLNHNCDIGKHWLKFETAINPDSILIPVPDIPLTYEMAPTYIGTMITRDSTHVYSNFVSQRKGYFDKHIATAKEILRYNQFFERYEISNSERLNNPDAIGDYLALDNSSCIVYSDGNMNLQLDYGQVQIVTIGRGTHDKAADSYKTKLFMGLDFHFSDEALSIFSSDLDSIPGLSPVDANDGFYKHSLVQLVGQDAADRMEADLGLYAEYRTIPPAFDQKLVFSDVPLQWNQRTRSYRYHGDISVIKVGNKIVNKRVEVYMELTKRASGDLIDIYFVLDDNNFYYLGYNPGSLQVTSSNPIFNGIVFDLKDTHRRMRSKTISTGYIYSLAAQRRPQLYLRRFMAAEEQEAEE